MTDTYKPNSVCAVTLHKVMEVADSNPAFFKTSSGKMNLLRVLMYLGFDVKEGLHVKNDIRDRSSGEVIGYQQYNVTFQKNALIRSTNYPQMCYTTATFKGYLRNAAVITAGGEATLSKNKLHHMKEVYDKVGVLEPSNLFNYIKEDDLELISSYGG